MLSFKLACSLSFFTLIKRLFSWYKMKFLVGCKKSCHPYLAPNSQFHFFQVLHVGRFQPYPVIYQPPNRTYPFRPYTFHELVFLPAVLFCPASTVSLQAAGVLQGPLPPPALWHLSARAGRASHSLCILYYLMAVLINTELLIIPCSLTPSIPHYYLIQRFDSKVKCKKWEHKVKIIKMQK